MLHGIFTYIWFKLVKCTSLFHCSIWEMLEKNKHQIILAKGFLGTIMKRFKTWLFVRFHPMRSFPTSNPICCPNHFLSEWKVVLLGGKSTAIPQNSRCFPKNFQQSKWIQNGAYSKPMTNLKDFMWLFKTKVMYISSEILTLINVTQSSAWTNRRISIYIYICICIYIYICICICIYICIKFLENQWWLIRSVQAIWISRPSECQIAGYLSLDLFPLTEPTDEQRKIKPLAAIPFILVGL